MLTRSVFIGSFFIVLSCPAQAQEFKTTAKKYKEEKVYNPDYGINLYDKLNFLLGGDSVRYDQGKGYAANGWREDFYENGQLLHKGYYQEGQLKIYKNFFDNGQLERNFIVKPNPSLYSMKVYYKNGNPRSEIDYVKGNPQKWQDWYPNGQLEFIEEYDKDAEYYIQNKTFQENGTPIMSLELTDPKRKLYYKKEYHPNGKVKEEGVIHFSKLVGDYQKEGVWKVYDENGKLIEENTYVKGELSNSVKK
jgi:antitoxin component YwqK of YwqJK toxin-antitoxin module